MKRLFPVILILLQIAAGVIYIPSGDFRKVVYWFAAAVLNVVVTF